jgi:transposase
MARYKKGTSPKLTIELIEDIALLIRRGCYVETASAACGISKDSFYRWIKQGKNDDNETLGRKLSDAVMISLAEAEWRDVEVIDKAANGTPDKLLTDDNGKHILDSNGNAIVLEYGMPPNWKASAWRLERKFPERWGRQTKIELDGPSSSSIEITFVEPESDQERSA